MKTISTEHLIEGMILGSDVKDPFGKVLLHAGQTLLPRHIEIIKNTSLQEIDLFSDADEVPIETIDKLLFQQSTESLQPLFILTDRDNDVIKEIFRCAVVIDIEKKREESFRA